METESSRGLSIAIDGPAGAGKSTTARMVARKLQIVYVDSGAMYRAVAWTCLNENIDTADAASVAAAANRLDISFLPSADDSSPQRVIVNGRDITAEIRTPQISQIASAISTIPAVREALVAKQRSLGRQGGIVMEGRDIGTVVLPDADVKVFLTASLDERARRRYGEMTQKGDTDTDFGKVREDMQERDRRDTTREISPLKAADDAITIDSEHLDAGQVVDRILTLTRSKRTIAEPAAAQETAPPPAPAPEPAHSADHAAADKGKLALANWKPNTITRTFFFVRGTFRWFYILMGGYRVAGAEYVPKTGPAIIAANHVSMADPPLIACAIKRPLRFMAKKELFEAPVIGNSFYQLGAFPVARGTADRNAIRNAIKVLANDELLIVFPEGHRGDGITFGHPEKGMAMIALKARVPIIPAYVEGTHHMLPQGGKMPRRARLYVRFGPPIDTTPFQNKAGMETLGPAVMEKIAELRDQHRASRP